MIRMENSSKTRIAVFKSIILYCIYNKMDFQVKRKKEKINIEMGGERFYN